MDRHTMRMLRIQWAVTLLAAIAVAAIVLCVGCCNTPHTVYVPSGKTVRLRQDVEADVWVLDAAGEPVAGRMIIPEGWYCLPAPGEDYDGTD